LNPYYLETLFGSQLQESYLKSLNKEKEKGKNNNNRNKHRTNQKKKQTNKKVTSYKDRQHERKGKFAV